MPNKEYEEGWLTELDAHSLFIPLILDNNTETELYSSLSWHFIAPFF